VSALAGVELQALRFALEILAPGTCLEGAHIDIDTPPAAARCPQCGAEAAVRSRTDPCPACETGWLIPAGGTDLRVTELLVHDDAPLPEEVRPCV
jgi:hydrogenase nickel incorporation protein HypA/HybF